jgi:hypothetical protein
VAEVHRCVSTLLDAKPERDRKIFAAYYGFDPERLSANKISKLPDIGVTPTSVFASLRRTWEALRRTPFATHLLIDVDSYAKYLMRELGSQWAYRLHDPLKFETIFKEYPDDEIVGQLLRGSENYKALYAAIEPITWTTRHNYDSRLLLFEGRFQYQITENAVIFKRKFGDANSSELLFLHRLADASRTDNLKELQNLLSQGAGQVSHASPAAEFAAHILDEMTATDDSIVEPTSPKQFIEAYQRDIVKVRMLVDSIKTTSEMGPGGRHLTALINIAVDRAASVLDDATILQAGDVIEEVIALLSTTPAIRDGYLTAENLRIWQDHYINELEEVGKLYA